MILVALLVFSQGASIFALEIEPGAVFIRVADVGAGLCCVVQMPGVPDDPGGHFLVYDAGAWQDRGQTAFGAIQDLIPEWEEIDLLVLSHSDADHLGAVEQICETYTVRQVLRTGLERSTGTWGRANEVIAREVWTEGCLDINLNEWEFPAGGSLEFGESKVTFVSGFHEPPEEWGVSQPERGAQCRQHCHPNRAQWTFSASLRRCRRAPHW